MRRTGATGLLLGAGLLLVQTSGCFGPAYNPYGYGAQTLPYNGYGTYGTPSPYSGGGVQMLAPSQQYIPGGTTIPGTSIPGSSIPGSAQPTPSNGSAPTPTYERGNERPVPNPQDPYFPGPNEQFQQPTTRLQDDSASDVSSNALPPLPTPAHPRRSEPTPAGVTPVSFTPDEAPMLEPVPAGQPPADASGSQPGSGGTSTPQRSHDPQSYRWLEGTVHFEPSDRTWSILYDTAPDASDPYAGQFTLSATPLLQTLREGEAVRLEGQIDPVERDVLGKPTYVATRVIRSL